MPGGDCLGLEPGEARGHRGGRFAGQAGFIGIGGDAVERQPEPLQQGAAVAGRRGENQALGKQRFRLVFSLTGRGCVTIIRAPCRPALPIRSTPRNCRREPPSSSAHLDLRTARTRRAGGRPSRHSHRCAIAVRRVRRPDDGRRSRRGHGGAGMPALPAAVRDRGGRIGAGRHRPRGDGRRAGRLRAVRGDAGATVALGADRGAGAARVAARARARSRQPRSACRPRRKWCRWQPAAAVEPAAEEAAVEKKQTPFANLRELLEKKNERGPASGE